jgi:hypothetical protein
VEGAGVWVDEHLERGKMRDSDALLGCAAGQTRDSRHAAHTTYCSHKGVVGEVRSVVICPRRVPELRFVPLCKTRLLGSTDGHRSSSDLH